MKILLPWQLSGVKNPQRSALRAAPETRYTYCARNVAGTITAFADGRVVSAYLLVEEAMAAVDSTLRSEGWYLL